jgi:hypothetical protein
MTIKEWRAKGLEARREYDAEVQAGSTTLDWEAWRVLKGYIVDHKPTEQS